MKKIKAIKEFIGEVLFILNKQQRRLGLIVLCMTIINAFLQMFSVSILVPIVNSMLNPEALMQEKWVQTISNIFLIHTSGGIFVFLCLITIILYTIKEAFGILLNWASVKYSNKIVRETSLTLLSSYMKRDYDFFLNYGSSKVMRDVYNDAYSINAILGGAFTITTEGLTIFLILLYILISDWIIALCMMILAALCLFIIYHFFKRKMKRYGEEIRTESTETIKILLQAVEGIKEVQVMHKQQYFQKKFEKSYYAMQKPVIGQSIGNAAPTYIVEGIFVVGLMSFICIRIVIEPGYVNQLPFLASFMMGAIRMLPSLGRTSSNVNTITSQIPAFLSVYNNVKIAREQKKKEAEIHVKKTDKNSEKVEYKNELYLKDICWHYPDTNRNVIENLNLIINKGDSIGVIGSSGTGKTTLADIILGLHVPQKGKILLDGINIQSISDSYSNIIGYVSQSIYLVDGSVRENVAFGVDEKDINDDEIWNALKQAQLYDFVRTLENGLDTIVGERGVKFSGGQRQRIAIARAMYRKPQILVLDEATSALDKETEADVMSAIESLYGKITMVVIAHRLSTIKQCNKIYEIKEGKAFLRTKAEVFENRS